MSKWAVVEWTHRHCEGWADPDGGRLEIKARKLAEAFAWTADEVENFLEELNSTSRLHALLA